MSPFEYVIVLISIILGLGITLVLTGIAELIRKWNAIKIFWPYLIWIGLVFVLHFLICGTLSNRSLHTG